MSARIAALLAVAPLLGATRDEELERWLRALDSAREPEWSNALDALAARGEPAAVRALADFEAVNWSARRSRAKLLVQIPSPASCERVLALLDDPDPQVRRVLVLVLGNPALAETAAAERVRALERIAREDPSDNVRTKAREALGECALADAVPVLDRLLTDLPADEAEKTATLLAQLPLARERVIARVTAAFEGATVSAPVLAVLLRGYGRALAEVPGGGEERRERLPFLLGRTHASVDVQAAARATLAVFVARAAELAEPERAERVLAALGDEGWPLLECLRRRIDLAWLKRGDPHAALELARALVAEARRLPPAEFEAWDRHGRVLEGAALFASGDLTAARDVFTVLAARLEADRAREDLFPGPFDGQGLREGTQAGGGARIDRLHMAGLSHLWLALLALEANDAARVQAELRSTYLLFLDSLAVAQVTEASDPSTLDSLLDRDLSPHALVLFNDELAPERREHALDLAIALGKALAHVAPLEMLGFEGADSKGDVRTYFLDGEGLAHLASIRAAEKRSLDRKIDELARNAAAGPRDPDARQTLQVFQAMRRRTLEEAESEEAKAVSGAEARALSDEALRAQHGQLLEYLTPSMHAHVLAGQLRAEGRSAEARALCERALETLRTAPIGPPLWSEYSSARYELQLGSTWMDDARPQEAERAYQAGERRLASIEQRFDELRGKETDAENVRQYDAQLRMVREMRADALLSLAVNANVRMGDPARALEYFERAYALNQNPFMRVLRACYRARSGKVDEARTVLASVVPTPSLYYNIACTHALLGETSPALDFLERDLSENHPTVGSRNQKLEWMRKDPDLSKLHGEPRFERLIESGS